MFTIGIINNNEYNNTFFNNYIFLHFLGVSNICFNNDGTKIAAISMDENYSLFVFDLTKLDIYK